MPLTNDEKGFFIKQILEELEDYAITRKKSVERNAETRELSALLTEKYGYGLAKAMTIMELDNSDIPRRLDEILNDIDPNFKENRKLRWAALPASISFIPFNAQDSEMPI